MLRDPVCHMKLDEKRVIVRSEYKGKTYSFCAFFCRERFEKDPEKYLEKFEKL
jgi:YHS domain-containing protein